MTFTVLCTGPSLALYDGHPPGPVIALKRAALVFPCDIWAVLDSPTLRRLDARVPGSPKLFTREGYRPRFSARPGPTVEELSCPVPRWDLYTATASLVLAQHLGATGVRVYGADHSDAPDWDGVTIPEQNRGWQRWEVERGIWKDVVGWLEGRGVAVRRLLPERA